MELLVLLSSYIFRLFISPHAAPLLLLMVSFGYNRNISKKLFLC